MSEQLERKSSGAHSKAGDAIPFTTEEPVRRPWLKTELEDLNNDSDAEGYNEDAEDDDETSGDSDEDSDAAQNKIKMIMETQEDTDDEVEHQKQEFKPVDMMSCLSKEMEEYEQVANEKTEEDILGAEDPDLLRTTESNRHIPYEENPKSLQRSKSDGETDAVHRKLLVFSENPTVIEEGNKIAVVQYYGAGKSGVMPNEYHSKRKPKTYLAACDFSKESLYAMEWTMGAMMRDGDELHIATVANRDDNPEVVKATGLDQTGELHAISDALTTEAKKLLGQMMLFNIKLVTHAMVGRIKDALKSLTRETDYTMIVCGSRGRGSVRTLLMGSISTYLVHKSPVPVAVIRRQKKKKRVKHELVAAHSLSEGIKTGHLHVDELS
ncbi:hypothetical protein BDF21DRAFT_361962 [Thamnidium elegans]|uniref:UspA domain-containing protein n=1 Tax=Thamnidium elegans TaxID=101142 RepID=A0A8H7SN51_9FUNG|nr:hypothetical protein INT48_008808 [Thamnidium elegans]KAI8081083.1 hypothetical protein BDF21DRAFT_361962 [Thamnidium elegans]